MPIFRWGDAWGTFGDFERQVDRLLSGVNIAFQGIRVGRQFPAVNLYELDNEYLLTAELPGTKAEDLEVTIAGGLLNIKGKRGDSESIPEEKFRRQERFRGSWQRSLSLPERVREEELSAEFIDGVLKIRLPKGDVQQPRRIPVIEGVE